MNSGPLQQDYARRSRDPLPNLAPGLMRSYPSAPLLLRCYCRAASGDLSEKPLGHGLMAQTADDWRMEIFRIRPDVSRTPDLKTTHRVLSRGLEFDQIQERSSVMRRRSDVMESSFAKKGFAANSFSTRRHWGRMRPDLTNYPMLWIVS
jgi:hypothetical protein